MITETPSFAVSRLKASLQAGQVESVHSYIFNSQRFTECRKC